jgi:hypothetical protein
MGVVVKTMETVAGVIEGLRKWVRDLPSGIADLQESVLNQEAAVIKIFPKNPKSSDVAFHLNPQFVDVYCARNSSFEEVPSKLDVLLDVCEAVRRGRLTIEISNPYGGLSFQEKAILKLSSDVWYDKYGGVRWPFRQYPAPQTIHYEPWDDSKQG